MKTSQKAAFFNTSVSLVAPLVAAGLVAIWLTILNYLTQDVINAGERTFCFLFLACDLVYVAKAIKPRVTPKPNKALNTILCVLAVLATVPFFYQQVITLKLFYHGPPGSDYIINTQAAAQNEFDNHQNPYSTRAELWWDPTNAPHVTKVKGQLYMFGVPYYFGYPYFPGSILTYEPIRRFVPSIEYIRIGNIIAFLATLVAIVWLTVLFVPPGYKVVAGFLAFAAFFCLWKLSWDYISEGQTDVLIPLFALYGFIASYYNRPTVSGLLFGWSFACKLLPGGLFCLIMLAYYWRKPDRWKFIIPMVVLFLGVMIPYILRDPPAFLSATILYYLTEHSHGDDTALYFFIPEALQSIYLLFGYGVVVAFVIRSMRNKSLTLLGAVANNFVAFMLFIAFSKMDHPNYLIAIFPLGCVALVSYAFSRSADRVPEPIVESTATLTAASVPA
jgi:hypothetical protein